MVNGKERLWRSAQCQNWHSNRGTIENFNNCYSLRAKSTPEVIAENFPLKKSA